jgi:anti-sigma B factor antagonist
MSGSATPRRVPRFNAKRQLHMSVSGSARAIVITLEGELDIGSAAPVQAEIERSIESGADLVIVDLRQLRFMDSTGMSIFVRADRTARASGGRFALTQGGAKIQRLFSRTGLDARLVIVDKPEDLLRSQGWLEGLGR